MHDENKIREWKYTNAWKLEMFNHQQLEKISNPDKSIPLTFDVQYMFQWNQHWQAKAILSFFTPSSHVYCISSVGL